MSKALAQTNIVAADSGAILAVIERAASDPNVDVDKMERLMGMYERISAKNAEQAFNEAMNEAQTKVGRVAADASNPQTRSKYASYAALDRVLRPVYTEHGFSLSFDTGEGAPPEYVRVVCYVSHKAGHTRNYHVDIPADGKGAKGNDVMTKTHAVGSGMQYGMRYLLKFIFNVAIGEDDDGNAATAVERVTKEQVAALNDLMTEVGADEKLFCRYMAKLTKVSVERVDDIPANAFKDAVAGLEAKRAAK